MMMREEDLIRIAKKLDKMVSRCNMEGALDLLKELQSFNMTLKLLQETRIGMLVNGIRKHCVDEEVVVLAKVLIKDWKRLLDTAHSPSERANEVKNGVEPNNNNSTGSPASSPSERETRKDSPDSKPAHPVKRLSTDFKPDRRESSDGKTSSSPPAKKIIGERRESHGSKPHPGPLQRKASTDSLDRVMSKKGKAEPPRTPTSPMSPSSSGGGPLSPRLLTGDSIRDKCIEMLAAALRHEDNYKEFGTNCDSMASEIEDHIYQEIRATDIKYKNRVRSRISNLKDHKNPGLRRNVLAGGIQLRRFATMSAEEMASDELKQLRSDLTQEAIREHQMAKTGGTTTDLLQCSKCRKKNCSYNQVQTRSADEPMTTFVLCNECGNRWKFC